MEEIKTVSKKDKEYPELLRKISDAPDVLYYRGAFLSSESCIAVVGTRKPSEYGKQVTLQIAGALVDAGVTIISGMAPGIDTYAHKICVEKGSRTIAVLGTGLDEQSIYPQENLQLSREIIKHSGCLLSEFPPGTPGYKNNFRQRNRIISALSEGVLVVEAKERSGSLITARYAKEQGKKLFAVPGPIYSLNSKGPNILIKSGSTLVESATDILEALHITPTKIRKEPVAQNSEEQLILEVLKEGALSIDKIIEKTKMSAATISSTLALMEISGTIRNLGGNMYGLN